MPPRKSTKFQAFLITLRERKDLSATALAEQAGVSANNVYISERGQGGRSISIGILRKIYYPICSGDTEWARVLILWAMERDNYKINLRDIERAKGSIVQDEIVLNEEFMLKVGPHLNNLTENQRDLLIRIAEGLTKEGNFQDMIETWIKGYDHMLKGMN